MFDSCVFVPGRFVLQRMSQIESVTLGEEASVVADCDAVLYASAKEVVWSNALAISDAGSLMLKLTVDMDYIKRLRIRSRVALMSLAGARAGDSQITGPELFWMCVKCTLLESEIKL